MLDNLKRSIPHMGRGLMMQMAPEIAVGFIKELFRQLHITLDMVVKDVQENNSLRDRMSDEQRNNLRRAAALVRNMDFLTVSLVANGIKDDFPEVASLFMSWDQAKAWLQRQLEEIKDEAYN